MTLQPLRRATFGVLGAVAMTALGVLPAAAQAPAPAPAGASTLDAIKARGTLDLRRQHRPGGLRPAGQPGRVARLRRRLLPRPCRGDLQRPEQGPLRADHGAEPLHGAAVRRGRHAARATRPGRCRATPRWASTSPAINFYDGQGFMVKASAGVKSAKELNGATICVQPGTTTEQNLTDWARANNVQFTPVVIERLEELVSAYVSGRCDAYTTDVSGLAATRASQPKPGRAPDPARRDLARSRSARWSATATSASSTSCAGRTTRCVAAEELGVTQANVDADGGERRPSRGAAHAGQERRARADARRVDTTGW